MSCSFVLSSTASPSPEPRWGHVAVVHEQRIYLYGGEGSDDKQYDTHHIWIFSSNKWTKQTTSGETPTHTIQSTASIITNNNNIPQLVLFGGYDDNNNSNDIHLLNLSTFSWKNKRTKGTKPEERRGHVQWSTATDIVVFGGGDRRGVYFYDIHRLDIASMTWTQPPTFGEPPSRRYGCSYAKVGDEGFVFGGYGGNYLNGGYNFFNDLHAFNLVTNTWRLLNTHGQLPPARELATMNTVRGELFICGGNDSSVYGVFSDCWVFNIGEGLWRELGKFDGRYGHTACELQDEVMVFGGRNVERETISSLGQFSFA